MIHFNVQKLKIQYGGHSPNSSTRKVALVLTKIWFVDMCALYATQLSQLSLKVSLPF